jgi:geranylgeranyl pyrophosphate synthase
LTDKTNSTEEKIKNVLDIYQRLQIRQQVEKRVAEYFEKALTVLETINVAADRKQYVEQFAAKLIGRKN